MMDSSLPAISPEPSSEIDLLLANIASALRDVDDSRFARDSQQAVRSLESALHTYGSVKHLIPKLDLTADQRSVIERQLAMLRERIVTR